MYENVLKGKISERFIRNLWVSSMNKWEDMFRYRDFGQKQIQNHSFAIRNQRLMDGHDTVTIFNGYNSDRNQRFHDKSTI